MERTASAYGYVQWRLGQIRKEKLTALTSVNGGKPFTLRWVLLHLIEETARHAGQADLLREAIDGTVGE